MWASARLCLALPTLAFALILGTEPNPPVWPSSVHVFDPADKNITAYIADLLRDLNNVKTGHYSKERVALLFKPGTYNVTVDVGYYVQVLGLGEIADDVVFEGEKGVFCGNIAEMPNPGSLDNFWRSAENFRTKATSGMLWAVSQACPIRRIHADHNLSLFVKDAWASGGYLADVQVDGYTGLGGQQQWFARNSALSTTDADMLGGQWNVVLVGNTGSPPSTHPRSPPSSEPTLVKRAVTNVATTPVIAEKPFISIDKVGQYNLQIPQVKFRSVGPSLNSRSGVKSVAFHNVFVAKSSDSSSAIQAKLDAGLHVVLSPGIYKLSESLTLKQANQVLLGIGMATLVSPHYGSPCVQVASGIDGVRVAGLMLQAGSPSALKRAEVSTLLQWGDPDDYYAGNPANPGVMSDIFARVGGPDLDRSIGVDVAVRVLSGNVIGDNLWLWRADHALLDPSKGPQLDPIRSASGNRTPMEDRIPKAKEYYLTVAGDYPSKTGLEVVGDLVTMYGLAVEHFLGDATVWKGEGGQTYFYQNELPYDVTQVSFCDRNFSGYTVAASVKSHEGLGLGVYSFFRDHECIVESAFRAPETDGVRFTNIFARYLNGYSGIRHVLNHRGGGAMGTWTHPPLKSLMGQMPSSMEGGAAPAPAEAGRDTGENSSAHASGFSLWVLLLACILSASIAALATYYRSGKRRSSKHPEMLDSDSDAGI
eukprot:TRINITY_DN13343_c0_g1_i4.p1 TRINITY_DN13343_c0_g1~~TRINITY_DN13343_c0_g1_i4.p1  ORF type:complete len:706 (+),score=98.70 TRINITY_DN13343_c0_g1_i4:101-2218(+)